MYFFHELTLSLSGLKIGASTSLGGTCMYS